MQKLAREQGSTALHLHGMMKCEQGRQGSRGAGEQGSKGAGEAGEESVSNFKIGVAEYVMLLPNFLFPLK